MGKDQEAIPGNRMFVLMEELWTSLHFPLILASGVRHRLPDDENQQRDSEISGARFFPVTPKSSDLFPQQTRTLLVSPGEGDSQGKLQLLKLMITWRFSIQACRSSWEWGAALVAGTDHGGGRPRGGSAVGAGALGRRMGGEGGGVSHRSLSSHCVTLRKLTANPGQAALA
jgi:hypothetical protein